MAVVTIGPAIVMTSVVVETSSVGEGRRREQGQDDQQQSSHVWAAWHGQRVLGWGRRARPERASRGAMTGKELDNCPIVAVLRVD